MVTAEDIARRMAKNRLHFDVVQPGPSMDKLKSTTTVMAVLWFFCKDLNYKPTEPEVYVVAVKFADNQGKTVHSLCSAQENELEGNLRRLTRRQNRVECHLLVKRLRKGHTEHTEMRDLGEQNLQISFRAQILSDQNHFFLALYLIYEDEEDDPSILRLRQNNDMKYNLYCFLLWFSSFMKRDAIDAWIISRKILSSFSIDRARELIRSDSKSSAAAE
ncbi:unnamed protein product [Cylicocyclus nassatus]|uniref:Uncharacterized protein n=1 Tax=Cylicocyclus nassatus TaxID=53992 RepID=A0AA36LZQ8_CYLNA|nr:unnamed protein product [Cylicocyclus nassatus]